DAELRRNPGVTLAETALVFARNRQIFVSSIGSLIDQTRYTSGAGFTAFSFRDGEIQKRSYPNSFGGQHQLKGYELVDELKRLENGPGLGTFAFDDEGVPAQSTDIIRNGLFVGYMTSRETASAVGQKRSNGTMRADGWARIPLIRMTNVSLKPGRQSLDEVFGADHAI